MEAALQSGVLTTAAPAHLTLVTWNIDGLDQKNLKRRTRAVIETLTSVGADLMLPETFSYLESKLTGYECIAAEQEKYFVATLVRRSKVYGDKINVVDFPTIRMYGLGLAVQVRKEK